MKKLYALPLNVSPRPLLIYRGTLSVSLLLLLAYAAFNLSANTNVVWKSKPLKTSFSAEAISLCGSASDMVSQASLSFFNEQFVFSSTEEITWSEVAPPPVGNTEAQAVVVGDKMYVFGGFDKLKSCCTPTDRAYVFDPKANSWTRIKNMPAMNGTGHGGVTHAGFTTDGTDIYFAGGYTSNNSGTGQIYGTKEVWKYDISKNSYSRLPDFPVPLSAGDLEYLNGKLHWIGGTNLARTKDLGIHYVLDLSNTQNGWQTLAPLPNPRNHLGVAVYGDKIYVFGGQHGHDAKLVTQNDVHMYDPAKNSWSQMQDMPKGVNHITGATFTFGDRIFIIGGRTSDAASSLVKDVIAFNPKANNWTKFTDLPSARASGVAGVINGIIYYSSGNGAPKKTLKGILAKGSGSTGNDLWLEAECGSVGSNWNRVSDTGASGGSYVSVKSGLNSTASAPTATADRISLSFNLPAAGSYHLFARVKAPTGADNSFWVRVDGGSWMLWSIDSYASSFSWRVVKNSPFSFSTAGTHTIDFAYREDGTLLDKVVISTSSTMPTGTGGTASNSCSIDNPVSTAGLWLEAECGSVGSNWNRVSDTEASAGSYVTVKNGYNSHSTAPSGTSNLVSFSFSLTQTGSYHIFARVKAANSGDDSFWVRVDGGSWILWSVNPRTGSAFDWREINNSPFSFSTTGTHTLDFAFREDGTHLDKLAISSSSSSPAGTGQTASNCGSNAKIANSVNNPDVPSKVQTHSYEEQMDDQEVTIFPNPSRGLFTIHFSNEKLKSGFYLFSIVNSQGKIVRKFIIFEGASKELNLNLEDLSPGVYILQILTKEGRISRRIEKF